MFDLYADRTREALSFAEENPTDGPPLTWGESFSSAWTAQRSYQQSTSAYQARMAVVGDIIDEYRRKTGEDMPNPLASGTVDDTPDGLVLPEAVPFAKPLVSDLQERYEKTRAARPELALPPFPSETEIVQRTFDRMTKARITYDEEQKRSESSVANFLGSAAASVTDPLNVLSLGLGSPAAAGIVRTALVEGAIGFGTQAAITAINYDTRRRVDPNFTLGDAFFEVAAAGVGGAVLGGSFKAVGRLLDRVNRGDLPRSLNDALNTVRSDVRDGETTPFPNDAGANATYKQTVDDIGATLRRSNDEPVTISPEAIALEPKFIGYKRLMPSIFGDAVTVAARPPSLIDFLSGVGIRDDGGELAHMGITDLFIPGKGKLVRKSGGLSLDEAREAAVEAGYLRDAGWDNADVQAQTNVNDFLELLSQDHNAYRSKVDADRVFAEQDQSQAAAFLGGRGRGQLDERLADFIKEAEAEGHSVRDRTLMERAADHQLRNGGNIDDAIERAAIELADDTDNLRKVWAEQVPGWEDVIHGGTARGDGGGLSETGGGGRGQPAEGAPSGTSGAVRDAGEAGGEAPATAGPLADPTTGGIAATHLTEDAVRAAAKEPDAALAEVHAAEHIGEEAAAAGRPILIDMEDGLGLRDIRDILREADADEAMAQEIGSCVIGAGPMEAPF